MKNMNLQNAGLKFLLDDLKSLQTKAIDYTSLIFIIGLKKAQGPGRRREASFGPTG